MRLVKLTLSGFKSFADRTELHFDEPVIGVVGPNGCGKSNIVDAIKWVLGERSSKSLRGKEMTDVIFAGSAGRKPSGMASVTLTFENPVVEKRHEDTKALSHEGAAAGGLVVDGAETEGLIASAPSESTATAELDGEVSEVEIIREGPRRRGLPIDADMVEVERRLFRDGASQYLINGRRARLKDIRDLFLDTGIGADAYSIIEQGKVDAMLLASPQERRTIFEEAAGIAKYKQRRIESQRKLERAQANLALSREQLANTERRLRMVKGQATKARKFKELDAELSAWRLALAFEQHHDALDRLNGLTSRLAELEGTRRDAGSLVADLEAAKLHAEQEKQDRHGALREAQLRLEQASERRSAAQAREHAAARAQADASQRIERETARRAALIARETEIRESQTAQGEAIGELSESLAAAEQSLQAVTAERGAIQQKLAELEQGLTSRRSSAAKLDRELTATTMTLENETRRASGLDGERQRLEARAAQIAAQREEALSRADAEKASSTLRLEGVRAIESELAGLAEQEAALGGERRAMAESLSTIEREALHVDGRLAALDELARARAGLDDVARAVLDAKAQSWGFDRVIAPLADLIDAEPAHARAIEWALEHELSSIVVAAMSDLPTEGELATLPGRATFVALDAIGSTEPLTDVSGTHSGIDLLGVPVGDRLVRLRNAVRARSGTADAATAPALERLLDRLLGDAYAVESADAAMLVSAAMDMPRRARAKFVLPSGTIVSADGRMTGGGTPEGAKPEQGVLSRRIEAEALAIRSATLHEHLDGLKVKLTSADAEVAALAAAQSAARSRLSAEQRAQIVAQSKAEQHEAEAARLERESAANREQHEAANRKLVELSAQRAALAERQAALTALARDEHEAVREAEAAHREAAQALQTRNDRLAQARVDVGRLTEQLNASRREHRRLETLVDDASREAAHLAHSLEEARASLAEHEAARESAHADAVGAERESASLQASVETLHSQAHAAAESALAAGERLLAAREQAHRFERDWHALEVAKRELEVKREHLEQRTLEDLRVDVAREASEYAAMMADTEHGLIARIEPSHAQQQIDLYRAEIARLGHVNLDAIDEEAQLEGRNEELIRQVADIDDAAAKLTSLIDQLNDASRARFAGVFAAIQEHFASDSGMFRKLFGGGKAEVRLMPLIKEIETPEGIRKVETGETDLLESGIEVIAKPPGKEPRSINQLSGGEKTLTAVALLLAIFKSKPSCFCVLDEVDAALDEGNVSRYCGVVREFTTHSHFIVITHNKKTMQAADRLYGITMQERGVSTRVTVKLDQVEKDGRIKATAAEPAPAPSLHEVRAQRASSSRAEPEPPIVETRATVPSAEPVSSSSPRRKKSMREALSQMLDEPQPADSPSAS
jgi:chromosome segregation protein